ncbi:MAG TPA: hypothetical protein VJJ22_03870 [Candidatus Paceibacterota bacterium]
MDTNNNMGANNQTPASGGTPDNVFWKYQANQFILLVILGAVSRIASMFLIFIPIVGWFAMMVLYVFTLICLIMLIVNIVGKQMKPLPVIGTLFTIIK